MATAARPPGLESAFDQLAAHQEDHLRALLAYLAMPSVSSTGEGMAACADHVAGLLAEIGFDVELLESSGWPAVLGTLIEDPAAPTVLFYGHYDVQPPDPIDAWLSPPFVPEIRAGRIYARGAGDDKGQHLACAFGVAGLRSALGALPCNVKILLEGEEEIRSPNLNALVAANLDRLAADLVVVYDGPVRPSGSPCIQFGVRGLLALELTARVSERDLHSGNWGGVAPNALWELVRVLDSMRDEQGRVTVEGFYDGVRAPSEADLSALARLGPDLVSIRAELGAARLEVGNEVEFGRRLSFLPSLNLNGVHGGYGGPGNQPVIPHRASAKCDVRLVADQRCDEVFARLTEHVASATSEIGIERLSGSMEASLTPLDTPWAEPVAAAIGDAQGVEPLLVPVAGGSAPNYVFTDTLGCPALVVPNANADEANHAPNENLEVDRYLAAIRTAAAIVARVAAVRPARAG